MLIVVNTCRLCDLGVQLCHLHSEQVQVFWSSELHVAKTSEGQSIVDSCSNIRLLKQLHAVKVNKTRKVLQPVNKNCTMKETMHSTSTRLPSQGQKSHHVAYNYMVCIFSIISQDLENSKSHT